MKSRARKNQPQWWGLLTTSAIALTALAGVIAMQRTQLARASLREAPPQQAEQQEAVRLELMARSPTLGFDNLIADWSFLSFLQYFGDEPARDVTGYSLNPAYFDLITRRDPRFFDSYLFISTAISYYLGNPKLAIQLMDRGTDAISPQLNPRAYLLWRFKGIDQLLLLGDIPSSIHSHEIAAQWVEGTPDKYWAPLYQKTAEFLRTDPDSVRVRFWAWNDVYYTAVDKTVKKRAEQELLKMGAEKRVTSDGNVSFALPEPPSKLPPSNSQKKGTL